MDLTTSAEYLSEDPAERIRDATGPTRWPMSPHLEEDTAGQLSRCGFSLAARIEPRGDMGHADALGCEGVVLWNLTRNSKSSCRGCWLR